jgi:geranylgeranyl pyrophosphate synthase
LKSIVDLIYGAKDEAKIVYPVCEELDEALQYEEIRKLFITANTGLDLSLSIQLNIYVNRISLTSTLFFTEFLELIGNLLFIPKESITPLKKHAINYGLSLQIVNDIADFIQRDTRTVGKVEADVLKDIQNKTMTLPIILHLQKGNCSHFVRHLLKNYRKKHFKPFIVKRVFKEMTDSGALQKAIEISQNVARAASIQGLNKDCLEGLYINDLQSIAFKNWYFTEIHDLIAQSATHQESLSTVKATAIVPNQNQVFAISEISNPYFNGYKWLVHQLSKVFNAIDEFITRTVDFNVTKTLERISSFVAFSYHT